MTVSTVLVDPFVEATKARIGWWLTVGDESGDGLRFNVRRWWRPSFMVDWSAARYLDRWDRRYNR